jgi:hypothetical protein
MRWARIGFVPPEAGISKSSRGNEPIPHCVAISFRTANVRVFSLTVREDAGHVVPGEEDVR